MPAVSERPAEAKLLGAGPQYVKWCSIGQEYSAATCVFKNILMICRVANSGSLVHFVINPNYVDQAVSSALALRRHPIRISNCWEKYLSQVLNTLQSLTHFAVFFIEVVRSLGQLLNRSNIFQNKIA